MFPHLFLAFFLAIAISAANASLSMYDTSVADDESGAGPVPIAKLTSAVTFNGSNSSAFNFGAGSGAVTMEFIVEGDPVAGGGDGYLGVANGSSSSLRYEQWNDTGQLGFTQTGVADYVFSPLVLSPTDAKHVTYVWDGDGRMEIFMDGVMVGERAGVTAAFSMPSGAGILGNNAGGTEGMVGTIHRITVYDEVIDSTAISRHADAFNGVTHPPTINSFAASPDAYLSPGSSTLSWDVDGADSLSINGTDVTGLTELVVSPGTTTVYTLTATNGDGPSTQDVTVTVNPSPSIESFTANRATINSGESTTLSWQTEFAENLSISPAPGSVNAQTTGGIGSVSVSPAETTIYTLTASSGFGSVTAEFSVRVAIVATHPVISEFVADNETGLTDGDGDFSDWIEVFNPTGSVIDLAGYYLTDDAGALTKWVFPSQVLQPGGRVVVFASNKGPGSPAGEMHTNFRLSRGGEYLALVAPDGITVLHEFAPTFPAQTNDVSYGILGGDLSTEQFMGIPTPGAANDPTPPAPAAVEFSEASRTFTGSLSIVLSSPTTGATVYYTTNGSEPSSANGSQYSGAVSLNTTTHLRAVAEFGGQVSVVSGETYIRLAADLVGYESDLPLMVIDNFGAGTIPAKGWSGTGSGVQQVARQSAVWATFDRDPVTGLAALEDVPQMISRAGVRGRGAFSSTWSQRPYSMEVWDEAAEEKNVDVLGMPAHSDWVLYYPDTDSDKDPAMMFNTFMYELSNNMGRYATRIRWVEAFVNQDGGDLSLADRRGVYAIFEKVSRGAGRLDYSQLSDDGTSGGFLLGLNRMDSIPVGGFPAENGVTQPQFFHTKGPNRILNSSPNSSGGGDDIPTQSNGFLNFDNPNGYRINTAQRTAIEGWFDNFESVFYDNGQWLDPVDSYRKYLDAQDFVEYFIFNNLSRNGDGMLISMFPWVGDDGKLRMGPAWDYNWSSYYIGNSNPTGTLYHRGDRLWYSRLFNDPDFEQLYIDRWFFHRDRAMSNTAMEAIVDGQAAEIGLERALRQGFTSEADWTSELSTFKNWLTARADWYDGQYIARPIFNQQGGEVSDGFVVTFSPPPGTIFFTTDGSDPRAPGGGLAPDAQQYNGGIFYTNLVSDRDAVTALVPTVSDPAAGLGWTEVGFDDSEWLQGTTGVGYDRVTDFDSHINLNLDTQMDGVNTSAYLRIEFQVADASIYDALRLRMKYDDGFVAYLNGEEIAAENDPASRVWNADATTGHGDTEAVQFVDFDVSAHISELISGTNVLAIHGMNDVLASSDFLISAEVQGGRSSVASGLELNESALITARTQIGSDWSAPSEAYFFVETVAADLSNLVISKIHYRPADVDAAEITAGFSDRDEFEFIELMNSGSQTLNLSGVSFVAGIGFDFSEVYPRTLDPGQRILLVNNLAAFEQRYGSGHLIAGEFTGNLSNDGELLTLLDAVGGTIRSFAYNDQSPWPEEVDGDGFSLVLIAPDQVPPPDHSNPINWRSSVSTSGAPGASDATSYASWKIANSVPPEEPDTDIDGDGRVNFLEYFEGTDPQSPSAASGRATIETIDVGGTPGEYFVFRFRRNLMADDVVMTAELSDDLSGWQSGSAVVVLLNRVRLADGTEELAFRAVAPVAAGAPKFARLAIELR